VSGWVGGWVWVWVGVGMDVGVGGWVGEGKGINIVPLPTSTHPLSLTHPHRTTNLHSPTHTLTDPYPQDCLKLRYLILFLPTIIKTYHCSSFYVTIQTPFFVFPFSPS
jgi:hypothetical protein